MLQSGGDGNGNDVSSDKTAFGDQIFIIGRPANCIPAFASTNAHTPIYATVSLVLLDHLYQTHPSEIHPKLFQAPLAAVQPLLMPVGIFI